MRRPGSAVGRSTVTGDGEGSKGPIRAVVRLGSWITQRRGAGPLRLFVGCRHSAGGPWFPRVRVPARVERCEPGVRIPISLIPAEARVSHGGGCWADCSAVWAVVCSAVCCVGYVAGRGARSKRFVFCYGIPLRKCVTPVIRWEDLAGVMDEQVIPDRCTELKCGDLMLDTPGRRGG
ncbi:hypothetical protein AHiyo1_50940 [Arthrobacter sp. Hiyo1]|nr:hypothetical protein AHiyo1_50940 [Arthrobacter sp. Hiyo1]